MESIPLHEPLPVKFVTRLTETDDSLLKAFAEQIGCTPAQLGRYAIRVFIHSKLKEVEPATPLKFLHEKLKEAEVKGQPDLAAPPGGLPRRAHPQAHGKSIQRQANGDQHDFKKAHSEPDP